MASWTATRKYAPQMGTTTLVLALYLGWTISEAARELRGSEEHATLEHFVSRTIEASLDIEPSQLCRGQW